MARARRYSSLNKYPLDMTASEQRAALRGLCDSEVTRSLLLAEVEAIRAGRGGERRTMRNLWYDYVKPVLSHAGLLDKKTAGGKDVPWPDLLSKYLAELVRAGLTTYEELRIVDGSRQRRVAATVADSVVSVQLTGAHFPWVILFTEKDTIWGEIQSLASLYGVSAISGGGQPSNACTENTVRAILASEALRDAQPDRLILLSLTDYDPFGYAIAAAQFEQIREAAPGWVVEHKRLGLLPEQLTPEEREAKSYKPKDQGFAEWYAETGGVDGEPLGLELDALPFSKLRAMFADGIERYVSLGQREDDLRAALLDVLTWDLLRPRFEAMRRAMHQEARSNGAWQAILNTTIPRGLFRAAAVNGWDSINPAEIRIGGEPLFECVSYVRTALADALEKFGQV